MLTIQIQSFASTELKLLSYVTDRSLVDVSRLPEPEMVKDLYLSDENITESRVNAIIEGYKRKVDLFARWQKGENLAILSIHKSRK